MESIIDSSFNPSGSQVSRGTDRSSVFGRTQTTEGTETTDPASAEKVNFPFIQETTMNTLQIIKNQIEKAARLHDAQITHTSYRGVKTNRTVLKPTETHGTFCYRGRTYTK